MGLRRLFRGWHVLCIVPEVKDLYAVAVFVEGNRVYVEVSTDDF